MTSSNGNIFRVTGHLCGEFTGPGEFPTQRPVTRSFDVYFDLRPNKRLSKQSLGWWFETLSPPLWRHRNELGRKLADVPCGKSITITIEWTLFLSNIYMQGTSTRIMFGFIYVTYINTMGLNKMLDNLHIAFSECNLFMEFCSYCLIHSELSLAQVKTWCQKGQKSSSEAVSAKFYDALWLR